MVAALPEDDLPLEQIDIELDRLAMAIGLAVENNFDDLLITIQEHVGKTLLIFLSAIASADGDQRRELEKRYRQLIAMLEAANKAPLADKGPHGIRRIRLNDTWRDV
jgi:hypothetical protein